MRIEDSIRLDFSDVLIKPKRSMLGSRKDVNVERSYQFHHSKHEVTSVPIIAANMDHTGTFEMAMALQSKGLLTAIHKHYSVQELVDFFGYNAAAWHSWYSMGISEADLEKYNTVINMLEIHRPDEDYRPHIRNVCIDVANGYSENMLNFVKRFRAENPNVTIMAGNVVTAEMTEALILGGADVVKVGIGPGCFAPGQLVNTKRGLVPIEEVNIDDEVLTHKNRWKKVTNTFNFDDKKEIVKVNDIKATPNHEFYVVHKKYNDIVTEENLEEYAVWLSADKLTKEYFLVELSK